MADIELVIKIPQFIYKQILKGHVGKMTIAHIFKNATPLPKGHGELIDRSKLSICPIDITDLPQDKCLMVYLADDVDNAEVIIEPDKENKE